MLGEGSDEAITSRDIASVVARADELLKVDTQDTRHLFWKEMKRIFFAMREVRPSDLEDETIEDSLPPMDQVSNISTGSRKSAVIANMRINLFPS